MVENRRTGMAAFLFVLAAGIAATAQETERVPQFTAETGELVFARGLVLPPVGKYGRSAVYLDFVEARLADGSWKPPQVDDEVTIPGNPARRWQQVEFGEGGAIAHPALRGGYIYLEVESDAERVVMLDARGHGLVYVNGVPRAGDPYSNGLIQLPILLRKGRNELLARCGRGRFQAKLKSPPGEVFLTTLDPTLPDLVRGEQTEYVAAVMAVNATTEPAAGRAVRARLAGGEVTKVALPKIPPLSTRKVPLRVAWSGEAEADQVAWQVDLVRDFHDDQSESLSSVALDLNVKGATEQHKRTFTSDIDGSVQYYAVKPATGAGDDGAAPALFLSLHGAGVKAPGQAAAYSARRWGHLVAATNRRPFGFDWEDWGRIDAIEALSDAERRYATDPRRTYVTGHSMGGHGVWHLGATYPDRFAAIGPSAGWISFYTYGIRREQEKNPIQQMLYRAGGCSETEKLARNFAHHGVYILHGANDNNVPVSQARAMRQLLGTFHRDFAYFEQPGAGHWWNGPVSKGTDCVDWKPMFEFFRGHTIPEKSAVTAMEFSTANPAVSARSHWACIEAQRKHGDISTVKLKLDAQARQFSGTTQNVARLALDVAHLKPGEAVKIKLDDQTLEAPWPQDNDDKRIWLERNEQQEWAVRDDPPPADWKGPHRSGPFKEALRNRMMFVYGTAGDEEENAWNLAKARYDAETFQYRGNGSVDVIPDTDFDVSADPDRNIVLYGNADTNAAWDEVVGESPIVPRRGEIRMGPGKILGEDLACLFARPRVGSDRGMVAVVSGTGPAGQRAANAANYFISGAGYPDVFIYADDMLTKGHAGVRAIGFFGNDWSIERGQIIGVTPKPKQPDT